MWRYEAIDLRIPGQPVRRVGEIAGATAADARAALRSVGLQVLEIRPDRNSKSMAQSKQAIAGTPRGHPALESLLRGRRVQERADAFDALATLLDSGVPLVEAVETLAATHEGHSRPLRRVLLLVREELRAGKSLSEALKPHAGWFDPSEVAMVEAAQLAGTLAPTLTEIASRQARSAAVAQKLTSALAYPAIVSVVGVAVALFLATRTLPQLTAILTSASLDTPPLTAALMAIGGVFMRWWPAILLAMAGACLTIVFFGPRLMRLASPTSRRRIDLLVPLAIRRMSVARVLLRVADLLRAGVPLVEALRTVGPGCSGVSAGLGTVVMGAAQRLEEGEDLSSALAGPRAEAWFDAESRRLIVVGEAGGDLAPILERLGERYERQTARLVDRLTALLEPAAVIVLAILVGTVVMAAVLPLLKLQEIL